MAMTPEEVLNFKERLAEKGVDEVCEDLAFGRYGAEQAQRASLAREFLREKEEGWEVDAATEQVRLQQGALDLAREANREARKANQISKWAALGAVASALFALFALLKSFGII